MIGRDIIIFYFMIANITPIISVFPARKNIRMDIEGAIARVS